MIPLLPADGYDYMKWIILTFILVALLIFASIVITALAIYYVFDNYRKKMKTINS